MSLAVNASFTELLKHTVHEQRPDLSGNNSFPSRHTSWAFTASTVLSSEFYRTAPWVSAGAHAMASGIGLQRVVAGKHYGGDIAAGGALGILSTEGAYALSRLFFGNHFAVACGDSDLRPALYVTSEVVVPLSRRYDSGFAGTLAGVIPVAERWGLCANLTAASAPLHNGRGAVAAYGWTTLGAVYSAALSSTWEMQASVSVGGGARRLCRTPGGYSAIFAGRPDLRFIWHLTPHFGAGISAGYVVAGDLSAVTAAVSSHILF